MAIDEEIELIETTISYLESAISELKECPYFSYKIDRLKEEIFDLQQRLEELEEIQCREWNGEAKQLEHEYWQSQL